jgi:hypothetical protein
MVAVRLPRVAVVVLRLVAVVVLRLVAVVAPLRLAAVCPLRPRDAVVCPPARPAFCFSAVLWLRAALEAAVLRERVPFVVPAAPARPADRARVGVFAM